MPQGELMPEPSDDDFVNVVVPMKPELHQAMLHAAHKAALEPAEYIRMCILHALRYYNIQIATPAERPMDTPADAC
jgi:hypothetical protein